MMRCTRVQPIPFLRRCRRRHHHHHHDHPIFKVPLNVHRPGRRCLAWQLLTVFTTLWLAHTFHVVQIVELPTNNRSGLSTFTTTTADLQKGQTVSTDDSVFRDDVHHQYNHHHQHFYRHQGFCKRRQGDRKQSPSSINNSHPIFLWGIPSTMDKLDVDRRRIIRSTYLDYFVQLQRHVRNGTVSFASNTTTLPVINRVCSLQDWTCRYEELRDQCQIIYVFFIGGNSEAPSELLDESLSDFRQMLAPSRQRQYREDSASDRQHRLINQPGDVYLNIRENQFDGKMTTWFQFAALVGEEYPEIDYAAKVDSDLLLFTPTFLKYIGEEHRIATSSRTRHLEQEQLGSQSHGTDGNPIPTTWGVYGGVEFPATKCTINETGHNHTCPLQLVGRSYMSGEMNFLSMDLAKYIVSEACPRTQLTLPHEDVSISNYVYSYSNNTKYHERQRSTQHTSTSMSNDNGITRPVTIEIISLNTSMILRTKDKAADGGNVNFRTHPENLEDYIFGHSSNPGPQPHLLWKRLDDFAGMWQLFMFYHGLSLKGPDGYTYLDVLNNRTRKIRYPGEWPGINLDRMANTMLRAKEGNDKTNPIKLNEEDVTRKIAWSGNQLA